MSHPPTGTASAPPTPSASQPSAAGAPSVFPFAGLSATATSDSVTAPLAPTAFGANGLQLERRPQAQRPTNSPLDWAALVLEIVVAPIGLIVGIVAATLGSRSRGFASSVAKAAISVGIVLTLVLGVGGVVLAKLGSEQASHDAIAASSVAWCTQLKANPATLASNTLGWPAPGNTIPASESAISNYVMFWKKLDGLAPAGIKGGTEQVESAAAAISKSVQSTQTLDDGANVSQMQDVVANSGIQSWVTEYCK
jgi:hypothetical protein